MRYCARKYNSLRRNAAAVASRWLHCVRFEPQIYRSIDERVTAPTNCPVVIYLTFSFNDCKAVANQPNEMMKSP